MNQKVELMKSRGLEKLHGVQASMQSSMRTNPMKWAGIAAGTGLGLGMAGRLMRSRAKRRASLPDLVIIDSTC